MSDGSAQAQKLLITFFGPSLAPAFELFKLLLQVTFIAHMFGCFFFFVSVQTTDVEDSWYYNLPDTGSIGDKYVAALYWAFTTMTTVGYGDITAESVAEKWYSVVIMMLGATVFGKLTFLLGESSCCLCPI